MKKTILSFMAVLLLTACASIPTVNQVEVIGKVENVAFVNGHYRAKVWCETEGIYYNVITDRLYYPGDQIKIK